MRVAKSFLCGVSAMLTLSSLVHADMKISARTTIDDGQPTETTIYVKEDSVRTEAAISPAMRITSILQCGEGQMIQINEKMKTYLVTPIEEESSGLRSRDSDDESPKQTTANFVEELRDTGERKDYFRRRICHRGRSACMHGLSASIC